MTNRHDDPITDSGATEGVCGHLATISVREVVSEVFRRLGERNPPDEVRVARSKRADGRSGDSPDVGPRRNRSDEVGIVFGELVRGYTITEGWDKSPNASLILRAIEQVLSPGETAVVIASLAGETPAEIAQRRGVASKTISNTKTKALGKLGNYLRESENWNNTHLETKTDVVSVVEESKRIPQSGSSDYGEIKRGLIEDDLRRRQKMADTLAPALNRVLSERPHDTIDEKKELSRWVNAELRELGLAIKCPKTGRPSILLTNPGRHPEIGRFMLQNINEQGTRTISATFSEMIALELVPADLVRSPGVMVTDRGEGGPGRSGMAR